MKTFTFFLALLLTLPVMAQTPKAKPKTNKKFIDVDKNQPTQQADHKHAKAHTSAAHAQAAAMKHAGGSSDMVMIINPEMRSKDLKDALTFLKKTMGNQPVAVTLTDGQIISNIMSIDVMPAGTMLVLKTSTVKGVKYHVVGIESVENIGHE